MGSTDTAKVISVIETTLTRRGNGDTSPIRVITQYWSMKGDLLAEVDPYPDPPSLNYHGAATVFGEVRNSSDGYEAAKRIVDTAVYLP